MGTLYALFDGKRVLDLGKPGRLVPTIRVNGDLPWIHPQEAVPRETWEHPDPNIPEWLRVPVRQFLASVPKGEVTYCCADSYDRPWRDADDEEVRPGIELYHLEGPGGGMEDGSTPWPTEQSS